MTCVCVWAVALGSGWGAWARIWDCGVMSACVVSLDYFCRWQVQVSVYCARWIPAHLKSTQCSIQLHIMNKKIIMGI